MSLPLTEQETADLIHCCEDIRTLIKRYGLRDVIETLVSYCDHKAGASLDTRWPDEFSYEAYRKVSQLLNDAAIVAEKTKL